MEINRHKHRVIVTGSDPVDVRDVLTLLDRQIAARAWSFGSLHNARDVTWLPTDDDIRTIVAYVDRNAHTL